MEGVAVCIITHDYGRYLKESVSSVLVQDHVSEIVIVDDASTDDTPARAADEIVESGGRIRYVRIEAHCQHEARREGFRQTTAPLICFLDADDRLGAGYIAAAVEAMRKPDVVIAYTDLKCFGLEQKRYRFKATDIEQDNYVHSAAVYRRSALERCRVMEFPLPNSNERFSDWWVARSVLHYGGHAVRTKAVLYYRRHGDNLSLRQNRPSEFLYCRDLKPVWERP